MWKQKSKFSTRQNPWRSSIDSSITIPRNNGKQTRSIDLIRLGLSIIFLYHGLNFSSDGSLVRSKTKQTATHRIFQADTSEHFEHGNENHGRSSSSVDGNWTSRLIHEKSTPFLNEDPKHWHFLQRDFAIQNKINDIELLLFNEDERRNSIETLGENCFPSYFQNAEFFSNRNNENLVLDKYDELGKWAQIHKLNGQSEMYSNLLKIRLELWKFCIIGSGYATTFVDDEGLIFLESIHEVFNFGEVTKNYVIELEDRKNESFLSTAAISLRTDIGRNVAKSVVKSIVLSAPLNTNPMLVDTGNWLRSEFYRHAFHAIQNNPNEFMILKSQCSSLHDVKKSTTVSGNQYGTGKGSCNLHGKTPCCEVIDESGQIALFLQHPMTLAGSVEISENASFKSTVEEFALENDGHNHKRTKSNALHSQRAFDIFVENDCLPSWECHSCLVKSTGGDSSSCDTCARECNCYCQNICRVRPKKRRIAKEILIKPPQLRKDHSRLIPRIIHQTYFEPVTLENNYTHFSKLVESWKQSGWEYNFYDDKASEDFLDTHFAPQIREAYDSILPGAYKADLFRLCVLLVFGGIYSDVDVELTSDLDLLLDDDIGFVIPVDEPGRSSGNGSCMWNGIIAAAPGHPFIAKALETVVNQIRNRFTGVDIDDMLCPGVALDHSHSWDLLFLTGPCVIGGAINAVMDKHMQNPINPGELDTADANIAIPGRTIILSQNKNDMGWHRFTWLEKNVIVAGTDMPDYEDRLDQKHYSDKPEAIELSLFGTKNIYKDFVAKVCNFLRAFEFENQELFKIFALFRNYCSGMSIYSETMNKICSLEDYQEWYDNPYPNRLSESMLLALISAKRKDTKIWRIMDFDNSRERFFSGNVAITNGQVMELAGNLCSLSLSKLQESLAGNHGEIRQRDIHDAMCSKECLLNDKLRNISMSVSNCACLDLSIQEESKLFKSDGSFCKENSADYLCSYLGDCGEWQCDLTDFGCKRIEYNQKEIPLRGFGGDCSEASKHCNFLVIFAWITITLLLAYY